MTLPGAYLRDRTNSYRSFINAAREAATLAVNTQQLIETQGTTGRLATATIVLRPSTFTRWCKKHAQGVIEQGRPADYYGFPGTEGYTWRFIKPGARGVAVPTSIDAAFAGARAFTEAMIDGRFPLDRFKIVITYDKPISS